ncbi:hypothetical protein MP638_001510 [Amoeboaphelidium occidentale]|nr:hypothetical protein MP638_001510 [Amoeboaphelidium occidentale]
MNPEHFLLLLGFCIGLCLCQYPVQFQNCGGNLPAVAQQVLIEQVYVDNVPSVTFYTYGTSSVDITAGTGVVTGKVLGFEVFRDVSDVCSYVGGCPRAAGAVQAKKTISAPQMKNIWGVDVVGRMEWYDANAVMIGCVETNFALMNGNGDIANTIIYVIAIGACIVAVASSGTIYVISSQGTSSVGTVSGTGGAGVGVTTQTVPSFLDLMLYMQFIQETGLLSLDTPAYYKEIVSKFGWSNFMPDIPFIKDLTTSIRQANGQPNVTPGISLPPNVPTGQVPVDPTFGDARDSGFFQYSRLLGLRPNDLFLYTTIVFFLVLLLWTAVCIIAGAILEIYFLIANGRKANTETQDQERRRNLRRTFWLSYLGNVIRIFYLGFFILVATSIFQFTLPGDTVGIYVWAGIVLGLFCFGLMTGLTIYLVRYRNRPKTLYEDKKKYMIFGALYNNYVEIAYTFFVIFLAYRLLSGIAIGGAHVNPLAQMISLLVIELSYLFLLGIKRPLSTRFANNMHIAASIARVVAAFLLITFIPAFKVDKTAQQIIGYVVLGLNAAALLCYAGVIFRNFIVLLINMRKRAKEAKMKKSNEDILMKDDYPMEDVLIDKPYNHPYDKALPDIVHVEDETITENDQDNETQFVPTERYQSLDRQNEP